MTDRVCGRHIAPIAPLAEMGVCVLPYGHRGRHQTELPQTTAAECVSCGEQDEALCSKSKRGCGHHCNHSWTHDVCCWCGEEF